MVAYHPPPNIVQDAAANAETTCQRLLFCIEMQVLCYSGLSGSGSFKYISSELQFHVMVREGHFVHVGRK